MNLRTGLPIEEGTTFRSFRFSLKFICLVLILILISWHFPAYPGVEKERAERLFLGGFTSFKQADYTGAIQKWEESLKYYRFGSDYDGEKNALSKIGLSHYYLGNYREAIRYKRIALELLRKKRLNKGEAAILNNLGLAYRAFGSHSISLSCYHQALEIDRRDSNINGEIDDLINIGVAYFYIGDYEKALYNFNVARGLSRNFGNKMIERDILSNIGLVKYHQGDYSQALSYLHGAFESVGIQANADEKVSLLSNIGIVYSTTKDQKRSLEFLQGALRISQDQRLKWAEATVLTNIGFVYKEMGRLDDALVSFDSALKIISEHTIPETRWRAFYGKALVLAVSERYADAFNNLIKAIETIESIRGGLTEEAQRITFISNKSFVYEAIVSLLFKMYRMDRSEKSASLGFHYAERAKGRAFLDVLASKLQDGNTSEQRVVFEREKKYQQDINALKAQIRAITKLGSNAPSGEIARLVNQLTLIESTYKNFLHEVKNKDAELASFIAVAPSPPELIQSLLDPSTSLLEYFIAKDATYAWLITKNEITVYQISTKEKDLKEMVDTLLLPNISNKTRKAEPVIILSIGEEYKKEATQKEREQNRERFYKEAQSLRELLITPVEKDIKTDKLIIVPHGVLHKVPFAALMDGERYLVDKYVLSVLPSASAIEYVLKKRKGKKDRLLVLANPKTDYVPLGFAELEGQILQSLFPKGEVYYREKATETVAKQRASEFNVIHFASHGEFNEGQPLQSGLLLTKDNENDGYLQVHEIFGMDLSNANLVTLSACETALSKIQGGDDLVGLSRGFIYAGTPSLLATLWKVDDKSTSILMENFYRNWQKGMSKPEALRQAQIALKNMPQYKHPFYWAPFVMIGDWQ